MKEQIKLTDSDWETLLPVEEFQLGGTTLYLEPLGAHDLLKAWKTISGFMGGSVNTEDIPSIILNKCPQLISTASGLEAEDVQVLLDKRPAVVVELVAKLVEINLKDYDSFVKNLEALAGQMGTLVSLVQGIKPNS